MRNSNYITILNKNYFTDVPEEVLKFLKLNPGNEIVWRLDNDYKSITITNCVQKK